MRHTDIRLTALKTYQDHANAIDLIESDSRNSNGDWHNCGATELKRGAIAKIASINARIDILWPADED